MIAPPARSCKQAIPLRGVDTEHHKQQGSACWPRLGIVGTELHLLLNLTPADMLPGLLPAALHALQCQPKQTCSANLLGSAGFVSFSASFSRSADLCRAACIAAAKMRHN